MIIRFVGIREVFIGSSGVVRSFELASKGSLGMISVACQWINHWKLRRIRRGESSRDSGAVSVSKLK